MKIGQTLSKALLNDDEADPAYVGLMTECLIMNIEVISKHFPDHMGKFLDNIGEYGLCPRATVLLQVPNMLTNNEIGIFHISCGCSITFISAFCREEPPTMAASLLNIFNLLTSRIASEKDNLNGQDGFIDKNRTLAGLLRLVTLVASILSEAGTPTRHEKGVLKKVL